MAQGPLICVSVMVQESASIMPAVMPALSLIDLIDLVEIRLDSLHDPQMVENCIKDLAKPVLVTNRPQWEGGQFAGTEEQRIDLLCQALSWGARFVDIELQAAPELRARILRAAKQHGAQVIISSHDFQETPPTQQLTATLHQMLASGADIGKIVTTAACPNDALRVLALQQEAKAARFPLSAFAMGDCARITRLATLYLGGFMTYVALSTQEATAPGQITAQGLSALITLLGPFHE